MHPYRFVQHQGSLYLIGYKPLDDAIRTWRVDRIESAEVERMPFTVPEGLDLDARFAGSLGIYEGHDDVEVKIRFRPPAARFVQEKKWHASQRLTAQADGTLIAELHLSSTAELKPWLLSFDPDAEVLEPASLRDEIVAADADQEVEGIEVRFTTEAAAEVGRGVDGRVKLLADGTEEADVAVAFLGGPLPHAKDILQGNLVAQAAELVVGIAVAHGWAPERVLGSRFLGEVELGEGLLQQRLVHAGRVLDGGLQQASGGQIVDLSRHPP